MTPNWSGSKKRHQALHLDGRKLIDSGNPYLTVTRQAELLGIARRSVYYQPVVNVERLALDKLHMNAIDEIYTSYPFYGSRRMRVELLHEYDIDIGRDRVRHLMRTLGLEAIYPKPNTSKAAPHNETYPYLLKGLAVVQPLRGELEAQRQLGAKFLPGSIGRGTSNSYSGYFQY